jgi:hypothetical protein
MSGTTAVSKWKDPDFIKQMSKPVISKLGYYDKLDLLTKIKRG